jgi:hypothetical protein
VLRAALPRSATRIVMTAGAWAVGLWLSGCDDPL